MINKKLSRPKIMSDAFSRNMTNNSAVLNEYYKLQDSGLDETDARKTVIKKYGLKTVERALEEY